MNIDYTHSAETQGRPGALEALTRLFAGAAPASMLDVGCGTGIWVHSALALGVMDVCGVDGIDIPEKSLLFPKSLFLRHDLTQPLHLGRRFDLALCLEVAEHLEVQFAEVLIAALVEHADKILFSAAPPGQPGQHHVNCQWPAYWQELLNARGYACDDVLRSQIWDIPSIEPWYRQNIFVAHRDPARAGQEPRLTSVLHPDLWHYGQEFAMRSGADTQLKTIEQGYMQPGWYVKTFVAATLAKLRRRFS